MHERAAAAAHLESLRGELKRRGLDGFVVPRADRQQNEYLPASEERLAWLTGFTGSAGAAIVLAERAAVFVDGRYTVQAAAQVDAKLFTIEHLVDGPPEQWLERNLESGAKLGYDPWLHTTESAEKLRKACATAGAELVAVDGNPIDALWRDRPAPPAGKVTLRDIKLAGESAAGKLKRIQAELKKLRADVLVVSDPQNVAWAFNIRGADVAHTPLALAFAIIPVEGRPTLYVEAAKLDNKVRHALEEIAAVRAPDDLVRDLAQYKGKTVRLDQASAADALTRQVGGSGGKPARGSDPIALMKATKNHAEIAGSRAAHQRDGVAMARFLAWLESEAPKGKLTEIDAVEALESFRRDTGLLKDISFPTIAGSGPNGAIVHYRVTRATNRTLGKNELFLVDSGAQYEDGTTDITRTVVIGTPTDEMRDRFTRVLKGHIAIATAVFPENTSGAQLDPLGAHRAVAGRARFRPRHRPRRRQLSVGARRPGAHLQARHGGAAPRHDPVERAGLLQNRRLRHSHREPALGDRGAGAGGRRKAAQHVRDADARADRPAADRHADADRQGAQLGRQLSRARAGSAGPPARCADPRMARRCDETAVTMSNGGQSILRSFPRKRESSASCGAGVWRPWVPAFAGTSG